MNFACEMMDLCRGTQEVEAVLSSAVTAEDEGGHADPLRRLRLAIRNEEKKLTSAHLLLSLSRNNFTLYSRNLLFWNP